MPPGRRSRIVITDEDREEIDRLHQCVANSDVFSNLSPARQESVAFEFWWCKRQEMAESNGNTVSD